MSQIQLLQSQRPLLLKPSPRGTRFSEQIASGACKERYTPAASAADVFATATSNRYFFDDSRGLLLLRVVAQDDQRPDFFGNASANRVDLCTFARRGHHPRHLAQRRDRGQRRLCAAG